VLLSSNRRGKRHDKHKDSPLLLQIVCTDQQWIRQALLYWDEIGSIVPEQVWNELQRYQYKDAEINPLNDLDLYRPFFPEDLRRKGGSKLQDQFYTEFFQRLDYFDHNHTFRDNEPCYPIYESKEMREHLFDDLKQRGLATRKYKKVIPVSNGNQPIIFLEKNTADIYMSLLAEYLASNDTSITVPYTDQRWSVDYAFGTLDATGGSNSAEIFFDRVLPVPAEDVSLDTIIEFKDDHRSELLQFRKLIDSFQTEMQSITDPRSLRDFSIRCGEDIELGVRNLQADLNDHKIKTQWGTLGALVDIPLPKWLELLVSAGLSSTNPYLLCAFGGIAAVDAGIRVGAYRAKQNRERNQILRESPYSYVYHAESLR
jgi:hypothetical protein